MSTCYKGEVDLQLLRHGSGQYRYPNSAFRFDGEWKGGRKNGKGIFEVLGGSRFEGHFVDGEMEGMGIRTWPDGRRYEGNFNRGEACGYGCFTSPLGESYVGTWAGNKHDGEGELVLPAGQGTYVGGFYRHRYCGDGQLLTASGFRYTGKFRDGQPNGDGMASYPGGSTFEGPFEAGRRSGAGGMYLCGVTGIHYRGQWTAGTVLFSGSRLEVEPDIIPHVAEETAQGSGKTGKGGKVLKGKPKASKQQLTAESIDEAGAGKLVVAKYDTSGAVVGLRCRCVLEPQVAPQCEPPAETPHTAEDMIGLMKRKPPDVAVEESGRSIAITLHRIAESVTGEVGAPVLFFVRRPDATDASESLGRFTMDGPRALFELDKRTHPANSNGERLTIVHDGKAFDATEQSKSEACAIVGSTAAEVTGKGGEITPGYGAAEARLEAYWQAIMGEVDSNRCLIVGAGKNTAILARHMFESEESEATEKEGRMSSVSDRHLPCDIAGNYGCVEEMPQEVAPETPCTVGSARTIIARSSHCTVCLDFRLDLHLDVLAREETEKAQRSEHRIGNVVDGTAVAVEKYIQVISCDRTVEVSAVVRLRTPLISAVDGENLNAAVCPETLSGNPSQDGVREGRTSSAGLCGQTEFVKDGRPEGVPAGPTWYLHAIVVRSESFVGIAPCVNTAETERLSEDYITDERGSRVEPLRDRQSSFSLSAWHALALVVDDEGKGSQTLCVDGKTLALVRHPLTDEVACRNDDESSLPGSGGGIAIGGEGGRWASLAVKNLAVYDKVLRPERLVLITSAYSVWREEMDAATAKDLKEDERWAEEAFKAADEGRAPEERPDRPAGADATMSLRRKTVRGEAKFNKIVLPKAVMEGGEWVLRIEDVSHEHFEKIDRKSSAIATAEEREVFPALPPETIKLEAGCE